MKQEIKIALVLDDYKVKNKAEWWVKSLKNTPNITKNYDLIKEEAGPSVTKKTTTFFRYYRLKIKSCIDCKYLGSDSGDEGSVWHTCDHELFRKKYGIAGKVIDSFDYVDKENPTPKWCPLIKEKG